MAIGDANDISTRIIALLPTRWFADSNPIRDAVIAGASNALALAYSIFQYVKNQTRIGTATDGFLDLISFDYFGSSFPRRSAELDTPFRQRILANLLRERATRKGLTDALVTLTGRAPDIFEPWNVADTAALGVNFYLAETGRVGSFIHNNQAFVVAYRPSSSGIPFVPGLGTAPCGLGIAGGAIIASLSWVQGFVTDANIYAAIDAAMPAGEIAWTQLSN